ncbi:MAG: DNA-binding LytR/AlgR family response regulator [Saprospiraceae bacterium]|jgi:DNA-binding LytR/AlgR family response regulator
MKTIPPHLISLAIDHILFLQAQGNYLYIYFEGSWQGQLMRSTFKEFESQYSECALVRVRNSYLANPSKVIKFQSSKLYFHSANQRLSIPVSHKYIEQVKLKLESLLSPRRNRLQS